MIRIKLNVGEETKGNKSTSNMNNNTNKTTKTNMNRETTTIQSTTTSTLNKNKEKKGHQNMEEKEKEYRRVINMWQDEEEEEEEEEEDNQQQQAIKTQLERKRDIEKKKYLKKITKQQKNQQTKQNNKTKQTKQPKRGKQQKNEIAITKEKEWMNVEFTIGNPNVEIITGKIQIYKDRKDTASTIYEMETVQPRERGTIALVIAIPTIMSATDFCLFINAFTQDIRTITILRDASPNRYMSLLEFRTQEGIDHFYQEYQSKHFSTLAPEQCKILYVKEIEIHHHQQIIARKHLYLPKQNENEQEENEKVEENQNKQRNKEMEKFEIVELPNCPVCLERLDPEISGVVTTMCNHNFHTDCLSKWGDGTCPVCRYSGEEADAQCAKCGATENLWICMICGEVGCGRYHAKHAVEHFTETGHTFAMEMQSQKVWDYAGDTFVHRLLGASDKDIVVGATPFKQVDEDLMEATIQSKEDSIYNQYSTLLAQQLNEQRVYWESLLQQKEMEAKTRIEALSKRISKQKSEHSKLKNTQQRRVDSLESMNHCLTDNQKEWQEKLKKLNKKHEREIELKQKELDKKELEIQNLQAQVHDLLMHFETQEAINNAESAQNASGSNIIIHTKPSTTTTPNSKKTNNHSNNKKKKTKKKRR